MFALLVGAFLARERIAEEALTRYLRGAGVPGRARVESVSAGRVVLSDVRLGAAGRPDLVAERAEARLRWEGNRPVPVAVRLRRPVLRLSVDGQGRLSLGALDALRPPPTGQPVTFPDLELAVDGGVVVAETPLGTVRGRLRGEGNLAGGFEGRVELLPATLAWGGCSVAGARGALDVATRDRTAAAQGALSAEGASCGGVTAGALRLGVDVRAPEALDRVAGWAALRAARLEAGGADAASAEIDFRGSAAPERVEGRVRVAAAGASAGVWAAREVLAVGPVDYVPGRGLLDADGEVRAAGVALAPGARRELGAPTPALDGLPLGPLEAAARGALARALGGFDVRAGFRADEAGVRFGAATASSASGARARVEEGGVRLALGPMRLTLGGRVGLEGGGFPELDAELARFSPGEPIRAGVKLAGWRAGPSRLAATRLEVVLDGDRVRLAGPLQLSGPVASGRVEGLRLPAAELMLDFAPGFTARLPRCLRAEVERLVQPRYTLTDAEFALCPTRGPALRLDAGGRLSGGFTSPDLAFAGELAGTPFTIRSGATRLTFSGTGAAPVVKARSDGLRGVAEFAGTRRALELDAFEAVAREGPAGWSFTGALEGGLAPELPVALTTIGGDWAMDEEGRLSLQGGSLLLSDTAERPRFQPLRLTGVDLDYVEGRLQGSARAVLAETGGELGKLALSHDFASAAGGAEFVADLRFGEALQPYLLSEYARGVIENVDGRATLNGRVSWAGEALASSGRLEADSVSFATGALGPVDNLSGEIVFTDLLGLKSPPGQALAIGEVNPGVALTDGRARFQLLGGGRVAIEGARWPFAGGELVLEPTVIDAGAPERRFTVRVVGLDAARFIERLDIDNVAATGTFDGVLPLLFSKTGSRIVGGELHAQPGGGTLAYVGGVGQEVSGAARLAFDALKSMRYSNLAVTLDGDLDGELVSELRFSGENRLPVRTGGMLPALGAGTPFRFNIAIRAPFRRLLATAASINDALPLVEQGLAAEQER